MDLNQLQAALAQMGVVPNEPYRASLYFPFLQDTQNFLTVNLARDTGNGGLGDDFAFVRTAVQASNLLQELANLLDKYIVPALETTIRAQMAAGNPGLTYGAYFVNSIFNASDATYQGNVDAFFTNVPITDRAVMAITGNFQANIRQACQRVIADKAMLTTFFCSAYTRPALTSLQRIESSGSDFHNGGKQVLFLTFAVAYTTAMAVEGDLLPTVTTLKIVYKPSDLEADCLLVGNSVAVNAVIPNFNTEGSLVEIFNTLAAAQMQANAKLKMKPLPTYRILPRNYMSTYTGAAPFPVGNGYGYIEYLQHGTEMGQSFFGYYPLASSDYIVFSNQAAITETFYRTLGHWLALACTFSFVDAHMENVRVRQYVPYLIDMELSLTAAVNDVRATLLLSSDNGGINRASIQGTKFNWTPVVVNPAAAVPQFDKDYPNVVSDNRLYYQDAAHLIQVDTRSLIAGYQDAMVVLTAGATANTFNAFIARTGNVLVRHLAIATSDFQVIRNNIFINELMDPATYRNQPGPLIQSALLTKLTDAYNAYVANGIPNYLGYWNPQTAVELQNFDIPIFYTRIGSQDVLDSTGAVIPIPANINIYQGMGNPPPLQQVATNVGRNAFFPNVPTTTNVVQNQLGALAAANTRAARLATLAGTLMTFFQANPVPNQPATIF